jgi:hypothetical protein
MLCRNRQILRPPPRNPLLAGPLFLAGSPDLDAALTNAIVEALDAQTAMSTRALNSDTMRRGINAILLTHSKLWEILRGRPAV